MMLEMEISGTWLRDNCSCAQCKHPISGQKLIKIGDLSPDTAIRATEQDGESLKVSFEPDGHESVFDAAWLRNWWNDDEHRVPDDDRAEDAKLLWERNDIATLPAWDWNEYRGESAARFEVLDSVMRRGFALLRGVPTQEQFVLRVAESFGFVRTTNYGAWFDVRVEAKPTNLAFTDLPISPHTDNPYRDPVPTIQVLHCLQNAAIGGDSALVDGFRAADLLRRNEPELFDILTSTPVSFAFRSPNASLQATKPMIGTDGYGRITEVRFNNRSLQPVQLSARQTERFYQAYRAFAEIVEREDLQFQFRLEAGDCLIFDNSRLLHARTAFRGSPDGQGQRHLQGCYADLDSLASEWRLLAEARDD